MVDGLGQTCGLLSASVPTQVESTGYTSWILEILTPSQSWCNRQGSEREGVGGGSVLVGIENPCIGAVVACRRESQWWN